MTPLRLQIACHVCVVALALALACRAGGEESEPSPKDEFSQALIKGRALQQAALTNSPQEAVSLLEQATAQFSKAAAIKPGAFETQALWADSLFQQASRRREQKLPCDQQLRAARERFAIAAQCPGVINSVYEQWAAVLWFEMQGAVEDARRVELLQEIQALYEKGLPLTHYSHERAPMERDLGRTLAMQARAARDPATQRNLYNQAIAHFESAAASASLSRSSYLYREWGLALLDYAKANNRERAALEQAVTRLRRASEINPTDSFARYNLACSHALLEQFPEAFEQLQLCLESDPDHKLQAAITTDTDLSAMRGRPEFARLLKANSVSTDADKLLAGALTAHREAEDERTPAAVLEKYKQALALYDRILTETPGSYRARQMSARCLMSMAEQTTDRNQRGELARAAQRRFAEAGRATEADWSLYHAWATMLVMERATMTTSANQRVAQLQEARKLFEKALAMVSYSRDEAAVRRGYAMCLAYLADGFAELAEKRKLCLAAIAEFEAMNKLRHEDIDAIASGLWGLSLMNLARLDHDRTLARRAIERMKVSIGQDPDNATTLYNLACAFVTINDLPTALRYLRSCLEHDPDHTFYLAALKDPDLRAVRDKVEFENLLREFQPLKPLLQANPNLPPAR